jgi:hypothetical protein
MSSINHPMDCCSDSGAHTPVVATQFYHDLPPQTFCCMTRTAYTLVRHAKKELIGESLQEWTDFSEAERHDMAKAMKDYLCQETIPESDLHKLMHSFLYKLTIAL